VSQPDFSADETLALLRQFEDEWALRDPVAAGHLRPPASRQEVDALFARFGPHARMPESVRALFLWHNGSAPGCLPGQIWFFALEEVLQRYLESLQGQALWAFERPGLYLEQWVPIFGIEKDLGVVDCRTGEILCHTVWSEEPIVGRQPSLAAVIHLWIRALREGAWLFPEAGVRERPDVDDVARRAIGDTPDVQAFI
jgi:hypothetical protein